MESFSCILTCSIETFRTHVKKIFLLTLIATAMLVGSASVSQAQDVCVSGAGDAEWNGFYVHNVGMNRWELDGGHVMYQEFSNLVLRTSVGMGVPNAYLGSFPMSGNPAGAVLSIGYGSSPAPVITLGACPTPTPTPAPTASPTPTPAPTPSICISVRAGKVASTLSGRVTGAEKVAYRVDGQGKWLNVPYTSGATKWTLKGKFPRKSIKGSFKVVFRAKSAAGVYAKTKPLGIKGSFRKYMKYDKSRRGARDGICDPDNAEARADVRCYRRLRVTRNQSPCTSTF